MELDPSEIHRRNEIIFVSVAGLTCMLIFVVVAMLMEHPQYAAKIRAAMWLSPPPHLASIEVARPSAIFRPAFRRANTSLTSSDNL